MKPRKKPVGGTIKWVIEAGKKARGSGTRAKNPPKGDSYDAAFKGFEAHKKLFGKKK